MVFLPGASRLPSVGTRRFVLRGLEARDHDRLLAAFGDSQVTRFTSRARLVDSDAARRMLDEIRGYFDRRELFEWGIARRTDDEVVGTCTLADLDATHRRATLGFAIAREHWGQGIITEVLPPFVDFAFEQLGLHRLEADADPRNTASIRAMERIGFRREGYARQSYLIEGEYQDAVLFGLLRTDPRVGVSR